jgi:hypothetical protein
MSVFLAHAAEDQAFVSDLAGFLESGCDVLCAARAIERGFPTGLFELAEEGLSSDFLVLVLSQHSCPARWDWPAWDRHIVREAAQVKTVIFTLALDQCVFPALLRRHNFVDGIHSSSAARQNAMRLLKRHIRVRIAGRTDRPNSSISSEFEELYSGLADMPGVLTFDGREAYRFGSEAAEDFDAVLTVPCYERSLVLVCGDLGNQLGLTLDGPVQVNIERVQNVLAERRCLLLLDGPSREIREAILPTGRTSTLITSEPVHVLESPQTFEYGRNLMSEQRYAEAYELFERLLGQDVSPRACRQELAWILEHWDRFEEAHALRLQDAEPGFQLSLF